MAAWIASSRPMSANAECASANALAESTKTSAGCAVRRDCQADAQLTLAAPRWPPGSPLRRRGRSAPPTRAADTVTPAPMRLRPTPSPPQQAPRAAWTAHARSRRAAPARASSPGPADAETVASPAARASPIRHRALPIAPEGCSCPQRPVCAGGTTSPDRHDSPSFGVQRFGGMCGEVWILLAAPDRRVTCFARRAGRRSSRVAL